MKDYSVGTPPTYWRLFWKVGGVIPVFMAVFTIVFSLISSSGLRLAAEMEARGEITLGKVIGRESRVERRNDRNERVYYVTLVYSAGDEEITKRKKVTGTLYQQMPEGAERKVRYLPDRPQVVEFRIGENQSDSTAMRWMALVLGLGTLGAGWYYGRKAVAMVRARRFGPHEQGEVVEVQRKGRGQNSGYLLVWRDAQGNVGESLKTKSDARYERFPPGSPIDLFRDARGRAWWSGDVGTREDG